MKFKWKINKKKWVILSSHVLALSEYPFWSRLNFKELLVWNKDDVWKLISLNQFKIHNNFNCKRTLNHLEKLAKWVSCVLRTYLHGLLFCLCAFVMLHTCIGCSYLKVKKPLARSKGDIQNSNGYSEFQNNIHLIQEANSQPFS